jgi:hypothetical protein
MITLTYEKGPDFIMKYIGLNPNEVRILCPVCGAELLFAPDHEWAARLKMHPGLRCPKDPKHLSVTFSLR